MAQTFTRKEILFTPEDVALIQHAAKQHQESFGGFVKKAIQAYLKRLYIVPDEEQLQSLELSLKRIGTNVNQIAFVVNRSRSVESRQLAELQKQMAALETALSEFLHKPDNLNELVREALKTHPNYRVILMEILTQSLT
jgi:hypothetical protein